MQKIHGSVLFPTHRKIDRLLERIGWAYLKAWWLRKKVLKSRSQTPWDGYGHPPGDPSPSITKNWVEMEQRLGFNKNLEWKIAGKSEEEARVIARVHWTSGKGPEPPFQRSGWVS